MADYIPTAEDALKTWCTHFSSKISTYGPDLGLDAAGVSNLQARCASIVERVDTKAARKAAWQSSVEDAQSGNAADVSVLRSSVAAMKAHINYSRTTGADLGVIGGDDSFDPTVYKAELEKVELTAPGTVTVKFGKARGKIDGVNVYSRRQGEEQWKFLARDTLSPYVDTTPMTAPNVPEVREYRIRAVIDDIEIGDYSDIVQITIS